MRFGGHQTFYIREGWLYKGLDLLVNEPEKLTDEFAFDYLGVGRNMASSIVHWLVATGLAEKNQKINGARSKSLVATDLSRAIWKRDKYFAQLDTWWMLHVNILNNRENAETWYWFFNHFGMDRFDREMSLNRLMRHVEHDMNGRPPKQKTAERDLSCLINTYAVDVPLKNNDPEDDIWCPFRDLDLLVFYRNSSHLQTQRRRRDIKPNILMYALELAMQARDKHLENENKEESTDIRFFDLCRLPNNPMRVFLLTTDAFFDLLMQVSEHKKNTGLRVVGLAGDRQIRIPRHDPSYWWKTMFGEGGAVA